MQHSFRYRYLQSHLLQVTQRKPDVRRKYRRYIEGCGMWPWLWYDQNPWLLVIQNSIFMLVDASMTSSFIKFMQGLNEINDPRSISKSSCYTDGKPTMYNNIVIVVDYFYSTFSLSYVT
jgi:hypothetical protein